MIEKRIDEQISQSKKNIVWNLIYGNDKYEQLAGSGQKGVVKINIAEEKDDCTLEKSSKCCGTSLQYTLDSNYEKTEPPYEQNDFGESWHL